MSERVLIIVENLTVPRDRRVWNEATTLRDAGYRVSVICPVGPGYEDAYECLDGVHVHRHPQAPDDGSRWSFVREYLHALRWERRLARQVWRERGFDVVHICNPPDLLFLVALSYKLRHGVPVIFDHHDASPELYESKFGRRGAMVRVLRLLEGWTFRTADMVISTNESLRQVAIRRGRKRPDDVRVVRNGPDPDLFRPREPDPEIRDGRRHLVGWVGHMGDQAGLDDLVDAVAHIVFQRGRDDVHFMVIGDGPARPALRSRAGALGVADRFELPGAVYGDELVRRLSTCDVGVLTLRKTPLGDVSTPTKTMEYMALARPVVQYDLVESRRTAGETAVYARADDPADFGDKILWLLDHPEERERLGRAGRRRVEERLAWRHQAAFLLEAYRDVLEKR